MLVAMDENSREGGMARFRARASSKSRANNLSATSSSRLSLNKGDLTSLFDADRAYDARTSRASFMESQKLRQARRKRAELEGKRAKPKVKETQLLEVLGLQVRIQEAAKSR